MTDSKKPTAEKTSAKKKADAKPVEVNWKKLKHFQGSAKDVPELIDKQLTLGDPNKACDALEHALVGKGEWCQAAGPALELLLSGLVGSPRNTPWVLRVVANVVGADQSSGWVAKARAVPPQLEQVLLDHADQLFGLMADSRDDVRSALGFLFAIVPSELRQAAVERLNAALPNEPSDVVAVSWILALGCLPGSEVSLALASNDRGRPARFGAAALARFRAGGWHADLKEGLGAWLAWELPQKSFHPVEFWWLHKIVEVYGSNPREVVRTGALLGVLLKERGAAQPENDLVRLLLEFARERSEPWIHRAITDALLLAFRFDEIEVQKIGSPADLTVSQLELLNKVGDLPLFLPGGHGVPGPLDARKRWLGLAPVTVYEAVTSCTVDGKVVQAPRHQIWGVLNGGKLGPIPAHFSDIVGFERWQLVVEYLVAPYKLVSGSLPDASLLKEIDAAASNPDHRGAARSTIGSVVSYFAEIRAQRVNRFMNSSLVSLLLVPSLRQGEPWNSQWIALLPVSLRGPCVRELLVAMPASERNAWLAECPQSPSDLEDALDLVVTDAAARSVVSSIREALEQDDEDEEALEMVSRLRHVNAHFREALADLGLNLDGE